MDKELFEKIDDFFGEYMSIAKIGFSNFVDGLASFIDGLSNLVVSIFGIIIMIFSFPFWVAGKIKKGKNDNA